VDGVRKAFRRRPGKVAAQLDVDPLVEALLRHPDALEADWRSHYGVGLREFATDRLTVREAVAMTRAVLLDVGSVTYAASNGWDRPTTEVALVAMAHLDRYTRATFDPPGEPYPRPWDGVESTTSVAEQVRIDAGIERLKARGQAPRGEGT
jgi:hypothetical protein